MLYVGKNIGGRRGGIKMVVDFITENDGEITGYHSGSIKANFACTPYDGHNRIKVPSGSLITVGDKLDFYDDEWRRKSGYQLVTEEIIEVPEGYVLEAESLRPMTQEERIINGLDELPLGYKIVENNLVEMSRIERITAGIEELPAGYKIEDDEIVEMSQIEKIQSGIEELPLGYKIENEKIIAMNPSEKLAMGLITQDDYNQITKEENIAELNNRLATLQTPEVIAEAELDDAFAAERKDKLKALLLVKKQPGWPLEVEWPV
jgi:hypothetical protein